MGHRIGTETRGRQTIHTLHDDESGASAAVLPSYGFNLFDLRLPLAGEVRPVLVAASDFADSPQSPAGNGIPILFPYPNRIRGGMYSFHGRTFKLPLNNGPNAIHGFAVDAPGRLSSTGLIPVRPSSWAAIKSRAALRKCCQTGQPTRSSRCGTH